MIEDCDKGKPSQENKVCKFDYKKILEKANYTLDNKYGYQEDGPLILIKLNKIYGWVPKAYSNTSLPQFLKSKENQTEFKKLISDNILVKCGGEYAADADAYNKLNVTYLSGRENPYANEFGLMPFHYYPYLKQDSYHQPLVFLKLKYAKGKSPQNELIHVVCRAFAGNIDSTDKHSRRGMTIFTLFVGNDNTMNS